MAIASPRATMTTNFPNAPSLSVRADIAAVPTVLSTQAAANPEIVIESVAESARNTVVGEL